MQEHQNSISLRFQTKELWPELRRAFKVDETGAAIILDICNTNGPLSYSRTNRHYQVEKRYQNRLYTWRAVTRAVDTLDAQGLINHDRREPGQRGWQSTICATNELRSMARDIIGDRQLVIAKPPELIILRDKQRKLIDYSESRAIERMRRTVERFNEALGQCGLDSTIQAPLARIFNINMKRGGRFYAMGTSWQNIKSEARRNLQIGGEAVTELDYRNLHPAILYAEAEAPLPIDCYDIEGWPRKLVKVAMLTLINAPTKQKARLAIAHNEQMADVAAIGTQDALSAADRLIAAIKRLHRPIAASFHSDAGARLMSIDAAMAEMVMNVMLSKGIVVLPVHDSFLVQASKAEELEAAMLEAAHRAGYEALQVDTK